jgi:putative transposase
MAQLSYRRHRFPASIIQHAIWLYLRFTLADSPLEEAGFELPVPPLRGGLF